MGILFFEEYKNCLVLLATSKVGVYPVLGTAFLIHKAIKSGDVLSFLKNFSLLSGSVLLAPAVLSLPFLIYRYFYEANLEEKKHLWQKAYELSACMRMCAATPEWNKLIAHDSPLHEIHAMCMYPSLVQNEMPHLFKNGHFVALLQRVLACPLDIAALFSSFGQMEAYATLAQMYCEHESLPARFCFVEYIENAHKPQMSMNNFWNVFIAPDKVVKNTMSLGGNEKNHCVLTGPNTGGKSATLEALFWNTLCAQTIGIVAADSCVITPFSKFLCHRNVTDNTSNKESLYKAECNRACVIQDVIHNAPSDHFTFVIMDEAFKGTDADVCENLIDRMVRENLIPYDNCLSLVATHTKKIRECTDCLQKHMKVIVHPDGTYISTHLLQDGISAINIADQIAKESGLFVKS